MKKWLLLLCTISFILAGCFSKEDNNESKEYINKEITSENVPTNEKKHRTVIEEKKNMNSDKTKGILTQLRPKVGMKKAFTDNNSDIVMTEEIVAINDEYIQIVLSIGSSNTTQIYKWTNEEITLVFEKMNLENPRENLLEKFEPNKNEVILSETKQANWELLEKDATVTVPNGTFKNVYIVRKITDEVVDEDTIYTRYYAPEIGLIKETFELTGKDGYKGESNLSKVEQ
jgi:hypothetical protein